MGFKWFWQDPREKHVWEKLNRLSPEERVSTHKELCDRMVERYGNIYFYRPHEHQLPIHSDPAKLINIHGNNSGGKSYAAGAEVVYEAIGYSPYREITPTPFGIKVIWVITTTYQIQLNSSQSILFSEEYAPTRDVGLLPSLQTIEALGGKVVWEKGEKAGILKSVTLPSRDCRIEFKSMEAGTFSKAGAAVDVIWVDEICPEGEYNELVTRALRKHGRLIMSYLVGGKPVNKKIPGQWVVDELYPQHEQEISQTGTSESSFYFFVVEDNKSLDPEQVKKLQSLTTASEKAWRFSVGGKFNIKPDGTRVFDPYQEDTHMKDDLTKDFDEYNVLYRAWDLGYARPACTAFQLDKYNRVRIMFSLLGKQEILNDFIHRVENQTKTLFPEAVVFHELLPHDARRKYDTSPKSSEMIFRDNGLLDYTVIYVHAEDSIMAFNKHLSRLIRGEPAVWVDSQYAALTANCMALYTRHEDSGEPLKDNYYVHLADNLKMIGAFLKREGVLDEHMAKWDVKPSESMYLSGREPTYGE